MSSSDPEYGRKGLDMSLAQRRYEWIAAPQEYVLCGGLEFQRCPGPPWIEAHGAGSTVCPTVGHAAASLLSALQWYIDSDDEFEIQVRSVDNDPTPTPTAVTDNDDDTPARAAPRFPPDHLPGAGSARAARWFTDPTHKENHRFKTLHSQAGVWGRGPIPVAVLTISVAGSNDEAKQWQLMRQANEEEYQTHAESLAQSRATSVAGKDAQTRSSKRVGFLESDATADNGSLADDQL